jgi:hypothetical protein
VNYVLNNGFLKNQMNENPTKQVFDIHVKKKNQLIEKKKSNYGHSKVQNYLWVQVFVIFIWNSRFFLTRITY